MERWQAILNNLKDTTTAATYNSLLTDLAATIDGEDNLTILTPNPHALDWLENRLRPMIEHAAQAAGIGGAITFILQSTTNNTDLLEPTYDDARAALLKPDRVFVSSQYFRRNWLPLLGPTLAWLIIDLRQRCYFNRQTGELRDITECTQQDLAQALGVSRRTVQRLLSSEAAAYFIKERRPIYRYSTKLEKVVTQGTLYRIRMDDPLTPEDTQALSDKLSHRPDLGDKMAQRIEATI